MQIIIIVVLFLVMYLFMVRPQQKRQKQHREMLTQLEPGQHVTTLGGIKAKVRDVDDNVVVLVLNDKGEELAIEKQAIKQIDPS
ncbi:preprotein translocase subunit YajC [Staphylococcus pettenkoferi]|uniref:Preprotein translocase subunit YajC n=1 Tax=Staphylococcus pettenkoferi TaxID=170573 RepID=A0A9Q4DAG5_9STAP|nr:preprotein translocase subunit YajC [Staphylococcus pettenkoferi]MCY1570417.1 preprotein translocase subunit YajC [Staphylococcus pettenkoferi]MCY1576478.1 preprotein translocase subunit YajC [Staphylococcus pettenkoferi]MCY1595356.1 preprotein translocase subunit YajC [Staphylococcus pettenkoferi]MCY1617053.1 preprotein translocase subunit YajC [Staphylococcus pettenkoferi]